VINSLDQLRVLDRVGEVPPDGPITDLLWADPHPNNHGFIKSPRGVSYQFGASNLAAFLSNNNLSHLIRSNQVCLDGYQVTFNNKLTTVWSAPNYGGKAGRVGAIVEINSNLERYYNTFCESPEEQKKQAKTDMTKPVPDYFVPSMLTSCTQKTFSHVS